MASKDPQAWFPGLEGCIGIWLGKDGHDFEDFGDFGDLGLDFVDFEIWSPWVVFGSIPCHLKRFGQFRFFFIFFES